jgi:hypothetical protein
MPTIDPTIDNQANPDPSHATARFARAALLVVVALVNLTALMLALLGATPAAYAASPSLHIVVPKPAGTSASGPVGANVSVSGTGDASHSYRLGYAAQGATCASGFQALSLSPVTAKTDGSFSATFPWPSSANASGSSYYVCAQDQALLGDVVTPPIQSTELFKVVATQPPNIALDVASSSNATPVPTPTDGGYFAGSRIEITGTGFLPKSATLQAFVTTSSSFAASDALIYKPLPQDNSGITFSADSNGSFVKIVTLPQFPTGTVYLHVVSTDYTTTFPPSLDAEQQITLDRALPTPTPASPTPITTVAPTPTIPGHGSGGQSQPPDASNVLAVIGLSGLSIILFVVGIVLMTSASALPRGSR